MIDNELMCSVIGVIDLQNGQAVHARGGQREEYQPVCISNSSPGDPIALARHYIDAGVGGLYVADLNAIAGDGDHARIIDQVDSLGLPVWLDAGVSQIQASSRSKNMQRVIGTESISALHELARYSPAGAGLEAIVLSIDLRGSEVIWSVDAELGTVGEILTPMEIAHEAIEMGVGGLIVLDLTAVGMAGGCNTGEICRSISATYPGVDMISGGGIRSSVDVHRLREAGCNRVLVGTALHGKSRNFAKNPGNC